MKFLMIVFLMMVCITATTIRGETPAFTKNIGQLDTYGKADCRFYTSLGGANYFFCADGVVSDFQQYSSDVIARSGAALAQATKQSVGDERIASVATHDAAALPRNDVIKGHVLKLNFIGRTNFVAEVTGEYEQEYKYNYFIGNDRKKWHTDVSNYSRVMYKNVWEGIDVKYYVARLAKSRNDYSDLTSRATMEYDAIIHPGADPTLVQFSYEGDAGISVNEEGSLVIKTSVGDVIEQKPYAYQIVDGVERKILSSFIIHNSSFSIEIGAYDKTKDLIIDPQLLYSTYLGGSQNDEGRGIAVDKQGLLYVTGYTSSMNFPKTIGAYDTTYSGGGSAGFGGDVFVSKLNPVSGALLYSTFIGGDSTDWAFDIAVHEGPEGGNEIYVVGRTLSANFPVTHGAYDTVYHGGSTQGGLVGNAFVLKLNSSGNALRYSTFLGGDGGDCAYGIKVDENNNAYVIGTTGSTNFPTSSTAFQKVKKGTQDAFVTKLNSAGSQLIFSTLLGGTGFEEGYGIALDYADRNSAAHNVFVTGHTDGADFPVTMNNVLGGVYVVKLDSMGEKLVYSRTLGGGNSSGVWGQDIAVDKYSNAYVTGRVGRSFPVTGNAFQTTFDDGVGGFFSAFMTQLDSTGATLLYSTYLHETSSSGGFGEQGDGVAVDDSGYVYISGYSGGTKTTNFPTTPDAYQPYHEKGEDIFISKFDPSRSGNASLRYSTLIGSGGRDVGLAMALGDSGKVCVTGFSAGQNPPFPTTNNAYQGYLQGGSADAIVLVLQVPPAGTSDVSLEQFGKSEKFVLSQNYPNPFSRLSVISCQLPVGTSGAQFEVVDMLGRSVFQKEINHQSLEIQFDALGLPAGIYTYSLNTNSGRVSKMMIHLP